MHRFILRPISFLPLLRTQLIRPFSSAPHHPTIDKILKSEDITSLQAALAEVGGLSEKNRETALKIVLSRIFSAKLPLGVLDNPRVATHLARHPGMLLEALLFRIKELMKSLADAQSPQQRTETLNSINDNFVQCFENLKKISGEGATRHEAMLHKRFADYNLLHLSKAVPPADRKEVLKKSKDFYLSALGKMGLLIREQQEKLKKTNQNTSEGKQRPEEEELKVNAIKETIRLLIQTNSENAFHLFMVEKELSTGKEEGALPEGIIGLLPYIERSLGYYDIFKKMTAYSIFYHRLKKLSLEIGYYSRIMAFRMHNSDRTQRIENDKKHWNELMEGLDALYKETVEDVKTIGKQPQHMGSLQEMTLLLLSIRLHKTMRKQLNQEQLKQELLLQVSSILQLVPQEDTRAITSHLGRVVKQMLEQRPPTTTTPNKPPN